MNKKTENFNLRIIEIKQLTIYNKEGDIIYSGKINPFPLSETVFKDKNDFNYFFNLNKGAE